MKSKLKNNSGFSLIEVLLMLFVVGLMLVLYQTVLGKVRFINYAKHKEIALKVANNKIEELRAGGYSALPSSGNFTDSQLNSLSNYTASLDISDYNADIKSVNVTIKWKEPVGSGLRSVSLTTLVAKTGGL